MIKQQGQILPVILFGAALLSLTMLAVFNTSQLSSKKQRLNNAADAAAYSAAVLQARHLNSLAYTNRAMIANQVFIAQMVSIESYLNFLDVKTGNLQNIHPIGVFFTPINKVIQGVRAVSGTVATVAVDASLAANSLFADRQRLVTNSFVGGNEIRNTAERVLAANDPDIEITPDFGETWLAESVARWGGYFEHKNTNDDLIAKAKMINDSRDPFSAERDYSPEVVTETFKVEKKGETVLTWEENGDDISFRWDALDILSILRKKGWFGGWELLTPVAWSRRSISEDNTKFACPPEDLDCEDDDRHGLTRQAATAFQNETLNPLQNFKLQSYYELKEDVVKDPRFPVKLAVQYKKSRIKTSDNIDGLGSPAAGTNNSNELGPGLFHQESDRNFDEMISVARAEVYFRRYEDREDGADEFANIWNPYWSARLVDNTLERAAVLTAKGVNL